MDFNKYVCWDADMTAQVMNPDALDIPVHQFLATHHPVKMYRVDLSQDKQGPEYDEVSFLKDFFDTPDYNFVAVLGESGTGKSHLVRWMYANIPPTEKRKVLLIPKARTNLKEIIRLILMDLEGPKFDDYRRRLLENTESVTQQQARLKLLHSLIEAVGPQATHHGKITEAQEFIRDNLPNLFSDPFFKNKLLEDGGIHHQLTNHIMGDSGKIERLEERRQFTVDDLPLNIRDINKAGEAAKDFYTFIINDEEYKALTVDWINRNLDTAINQVMAFRGEDMFNLMLEVREALAEKNQELVLLVEDFAKLQGIDLQLLEALLIRPHMGDRRLCDLRVVLASTTGFFNRLEKTVITRIAFGVTLDINVEGTSKIFGEEDIIEFTARYLNAVRLKDKDLKSWFNAGDRDGGGELLPLPNACDDCQHRIKCHSGFGSSKKLGMGLYPFSRNAIIKMLGHISPRQFNPRLFIDRALRHTLYNYKKHIEEGRFPPIQLLRHFAQPLMGALELDALKKMDPKSFERRQTLLEIWGNGKVENLHPEIHKAFDLPLLEKMAETPEEREQEQGEAAGLNASVKSLEKILEEELPERINQKIRELNQWQNRDTLSQDLAQELRTNIYAALSAHINWDSFFMLQSDFQGPTRLFKPRCITFEKQSTTAVVGVGTQDINLNIPLRGESLTDNALALQAIIYFQHYRHWKFSKGPYYLRVYNRHLEKWGRHVFEQLCKSDESQPDWNPVPGLVELLALGGRMTGGGGDSGNIEAQIESLFIEMPPVENSNRSKEWQSLYNLLRKNRVAWESAQKNGVMEILLARTGCTKGGSTPVQMVDAASFLAPLESLNSQWLPVTEIPTKPKPNYEIIPKLRKDLDKRILDAVEAEVDLCEKWLEKIKSAFGQSSKELILANLRETVGKAQNAGVMGVNQDQMEAIIQRFQSYEYDKTLESMELNIKEKDRGNLLLQLGRLDERAMHIAELMVDAAEKFVDQTLQRIERDKVGLAQWGDKPQDIQAKIKSHFNSLEDLLVSIEGGSSS